MRLRDRLRWRRETHRPAAVPGNRFALLAGGPAWFGALRDAIRRARHEVLVESYIWADDRVGRAMLAEAGAAARRGVRVRIVVDAFGSLGLGDRPLRAFRAAGGELGFYNPFRWTFRLGRLARRNHRKLAVIDGATGFIGGFAIRDDWTAAPPAGRWDVGARVAGPIVDQFRRVIARDWARCRKPPLPEPGPGAPRRAGRETLRLLPSAYGRHHLFRRLRRTLHESRSRAYVCASYFIPSFRMRRALRRAARRGVDVRLLLPTPRTEAVAFRFAGRRHYGSLLRAGVRIFEFQPSFLHAKYAVVDRGWGYVGSSNLDNWSGRFDLEADLETLSRGAVDALARRFLADARRAREILYARWRRRALWITLLERLFGRFDPWL